MLHVKLNLKWADCVKNRHIAKNGIAVFNSVSITYK